MTKFEQLFKIANGHWFSVTVVNSQQAIHKVQSFLVRNFGLTDSEALAVVVYDRLQEKLHHFNNSIVEANMELSNALAKLSGKTLPELIP